MGRTRLQPTPRTVAPLRSGRHHPTLRNDVQQPALFDAFHDSPWETFVIDEQALMRVALDLGAGSIGGPLSGAEKQVLNAASRRTSVDKAIVERVRRAILVGDDPLGTAFMTLRRAEVRRQVGAVYTPRHLVRPMVDWVLAQQPDRVIDAGSGSGRFSLEIGLRSIRLPIVAVEIDPVASILTRAVLAVLRHPAGTVLNVDFTQLSLEGSVGKTAFVGNPPYVRHHLLSSLAKRWAQETARRLGISISGLAGLHAHFFLATSSLARDGDVGCFVTSAEWLDVNYGEVVRDLLLNKLGGDSIHFIEPTAVPFEQTATTAAITCFKVGKEPRSLRLKLVKKPDQIRALKGGRAVSRDRLKEAHRWTPFFRARNDIPEGYIELGELCRVHRGAVTGANSIWVTGSDRHNLPQKVLFPSVTRAKELFAAGSSPLSITGLRSVIDLPEDLDVFGPEERARIEAFLRWAKRAGAADGYVARNRRAWWSIGLRQPAPILATYMARRPPTFVRNLAEARHINIAHGLYPRVKLTKTGLDRLAKALRDSVSVAQGRTYAGGLTKFEPREMERLPIPDLPTLIRA